MSGSVATSTSGNSSQVILVPLSSDVILTVVVVVTNVLFDSAPMTATTKGPRIPSALDESTEWMIHCISSEQWQQKLYKWRWLLSHCTPLVLHHWTGLLLQRLREWRWHQYVYKDTSNLSVCVYVGFNTWSSLCSVWCQQRVTMLNCTKREHLHISNTGTM